MLQSQLYSQVPYNENSSDTELNELDYNLDQILEDINSMVSKINELNQSLPDEVSLGFVKVSCMNVKKTILDRREKIQQRLYYLIYLIIKFNYEELKKEKIRLINKMNYVPTNIRMLAELNRYLEEVPHHVDRFNLKIEETYEM